MTSACSSINSPYARVASSLDVCHCEEESIGDDSQPRYGGVAILCIGRLRRLRQLADPRNDICSMPKVSY